MKVKITLIRTLFLVLCCTLISRMGFSQTSCQVLITNDAQVSPTEYEFDLYLVSTGSGTFQLSTNQYGINYNPAIKGTGTLTASWVGATQLSNPAQRQATINTVSNPSQIRIASPTPPGAGNGSIIATAPGTLVGRMRLTNSVPFTQAQPNFSFSSTASASSTRTGIGWYNGTTNTPFCGFGIATGCTGTVAGVLSYSNPILNAPTCTAPTLSASTVNATCDGGNDGSIDLTITGGSPSPFNISWSNGASTEDIGGLTAGTYTVIVTTDGGGCSATASYTVNDGAPNVTYYADGDGDGFGDPLVTQVSCTGTPAGFVANNTDCDDSNGSINPNAAEVCNNIDDDCDGQTDEGLTFLTYYVDTDSDGFGSSTATGVSSCNPIAGSVTNNLDCDDNNNAINPNGTEVCNGIDDDCDGTPDDGLAFLPYYADVDGDTFGGALLGNFCAQPVNSVAVGGDCNDNDPSINPNAAEICNSIDDDCDGLSDEGLTFADYYADVDGDTYGGAFLGNLCAQPLGSVTIAGDCNDNDPAVNPGATEVCNSIDDDCDGQTDEGVLNTYYADGDGDGFGAGAPILACTQPANTSVNNLDCDDSNAAINPNATEICNNIDDDCDGQTDEGLTSQLYYVDADSDGFGDANATGVSSCTPIPGSVTNNGDCNDNDNAVNPGAAEACNSIDDDCDGQTDEGVLNTYYADGDGDGFGAGAPILACTQPANTSVNNLDCDDSNAAINPNAAEICNNIDDDCDGSTDEGLTFLNYYVDGDGDGFGAGAPTSSCTPISGSVTVDGDCDDSNSAINPNAAEVCNNIDDDCDGSTDEGLTFLNYYVDGDGDGFGAGAATSSCAPISGSVTVDGDCDDNSNTVFPGAPEQCNNIDDDCDGQTDENTVISTWYADTDGDTFGDPNVSVQNCAQPSGFVLDNTDCDDNNSAVNPGATEVCNNIDDDCDGQTDEGVQNTYYADGDGDGFGAGAPILACTQPANTSVNNLDCDDSNAAINPNAAEVCNSIDDDCDGQTDEGVLNTYYADVDGDGFGNPAVTATGCTAPSGFVADNTDCDDSNGAINPGAAEVCNNIDDDCDGLTDEGVLNTYYADVDGDGFGNASVTATGCTAPSGFVADNTDCDDTNGAINPGASEICNNIDDDCDGLTDEGLTALVYYVDADGDGFGDATATGISSCTPIAGSVTNNLDCNDEDPAINPNAAEVCNNIDDDCDGSTDEGLPTFTYYADADADTYGDAGNALVTCNPSIPSGFVTDATDCNDNNALVNPAANEVCGNNIDDDCDGATDEGCGCANPPTANAGSDQSICAGQDASLNGVIGGGSTNGTWSSAGDGSFSPNASVLNATYIPGPNDIANGSVLLTLTTDAGPFCTPASSSLTITILDLPASPGAISGPAALCNPFNQTITYSVAPVAGATSYNWTVPAGTNILNGQGTTSITVSWPFSNIHNSVVGNICVTANNANSCGSGTPSCLGISVRLTIPVTPPSISGPAKACPGETVTYSVGVVARADNYVWTVPSGASVISGQNTNIVQVQYSAGFTGGPISVVATNICGVSPARTKNISLNVLPAPSPITGPASGNCGLLGVPYSVNPVVGATSYLWTVPAGATIASGQGTNSITVDYSGSFGSGPITVVAQNGCGNGTARSLSVIGAPGLPSVISGPTALCANQNYNFSVATLAGAATYTWTVPSGFSVVSGQGTKDVVIKAGPSPASGLTISVRGSNACGTGAIRTLTGVSITACPRLGEGTIAGISAFPNPASDLLNVRFNSEKNQDVVLTLMDAAGRIVVLENRNADEGVNQYELNVQGLASGIYTLQVQTSDMVEKMRIMVE